MRVFTARFLLQNNRLRQKKERTAYGKQTTEKEIHHQGKQGRVYRNCNYFGDYSVSCRFFFVIRNVLRGEDLLKGSWKYTANIENAGDTDFTYHFAQDGSMYMESIYATNNGRTS